ncbi:MAG TPA: hypothetical protein VGC16_08600 [Rhizomicrobium sp.]
MEFWIPEQSSGEIVAGERLEAQAVRAGVACWTAEKGARRFPASPDAVLALGHALLIDVLEEGNDYQYRSVDAALHGGFGDFSGRRLSDIVAALPRFGIGLRMLYDMVRTSGEPLFYRGWVGADLPDAQFVYHESAVLPFGAAQVDHILVVSALVPRDPLYPPPA